MSIIHTISVLTNPSLFNMRRYKYINPFERNMYAGHQDGTINQKLRGVTPGLDSYLIGKRLFDI